MTVIEQLRDITEDIDEAEARIRDLKDHRDKLVRDARDERIGYSDIRDATGMSISWINGSLVRTKGYRPRAGRPRRRVA